MPKFIEFYEEYKADKTIADKFEIISVHNKSAKAPDWKTLDENKAKNRNVKDKWNGKDMTWPEMIDGDGESVKAYGVKGFPSMVIIDPEGNVHQAAHFIFADFKAIVDKVKAGEKIERMKAEVEEEEEEGSDEKN